MADGPRLGVAAPDEDGRATGGLDHVAQRDRPTRASEHAVREPDDVGRAVQQRRGSGQEQGA